MKWLGSNSIWLVTAACLIAWLFSFLPLIIYLYQDWNNRFSDLISRFSEKAINLYLVKYFPSQNVPVNNDHRGQFKQQVTRRYGKRRFCLPLLLLILTVGIAISLVLTSVLNWLELDSNCFAIPAIAVSAILGAFLWTASDEISRFGTGDLTPNDIYTWCFRFLIAVPMGYSLASTVKEDVGVPLAFFLGTFPTNTLAVFGRRFVMKRLDIADQPPSEKAELELIQGINKPEAERFRETGITTILQLAYVDPIDATLRTNYDFNYVIDCMSQSLLWLYLDKSINLDKLRALGLRGAYESRVLWLFLESSDATQKAMGEKNFSEVAKVLGLDETAFRKTLFEIAEDPYAVFLFELWNS